MVLPGSLQEEDEGTVTQVEGRIIKINKAVSCPGEAREDWFTVGQLWIVAQNWYRRQSGQPLLQRIASMDELAVGGALSFTYPNEHEPCLLVRISTGEFVAFNQKCTHLSCAVIPRPAEGSFYCPCHEGRFDLRTGAPTAGPPRRPLTRVVLETRGRDIYAAGVEERTL